MRTLIGVWIWTVVLGGGGAALIAFRDAPALEPARRLLRYLREDAVTCTLVLPREVKATAWANVLVRDPERFLRRVGCVKRVENANGRTRLTLEIFPEDAARFRAGVRAVFFTVPGSAAWIMTTLVPPERVAHIRSLWAAFYAGEREAIAATLWPAVKESLREILRFYETEVPRVIRENRPALDAFMARHRRGAFEQAFMPALQDVVWERARQRFAPLLEEVGRELWHRLPVWGLGWRYVYEAVPFTGEDHVAARFNRFLEQDALPLLKARTGRVVQLLSEVFRDTVRDPRVAAAMKKVVAEVAGDPETLRLARKLTFDLILRNDRLRALVQRRWEDKGLKEAVAAISHRFEPLIHDAVNAIVLAPDGEHMNPRLARVLRSRVLKKDGAWVLLEPGPAPGLAPGAVLPGRIDDHG